MPWPWPCRCRTLRWLLPLSLLLSGSMGCRPPQVVPSSDGPQIRYRPGDPPDASAGWLVAEVGGQWDEGLAAAATELLSVMQSRGARITPDVGALAAARAGFPGQARFARVLTGGPLPEAVVLDVLADSGGRLLDVGLARRDYADGITVWVVGWAPHVASIDPLPVQLALDAPLLLRMDLLQDRESRLYVAPPDGPVTEQDIRSGVARVLNDFHVPGAYRLEVIAGEELQSEVALLFSVFVDRDLPGLPVLSDAVPLPPPDPHRAEVALYAALQSLREERGLLPVERFPLFEAAAREHSALMAAHGIIRHRIPGVTEGVPSRVQSMASPAARHHESVAAAASPAEAMSLIATSPAHLRELLCAACTHAAIGVALEPVLDRPPRLFVTWELLEFPVGLPRPTDPGAAPLR